MEFVRQIIDSALLDKIILPQSLRGKKVEIIVLPLSCETNEDENSNEDTIDNFVGVLDKYKNPSLTPYEKEAWAEAMVEKHGGY